MVKFALLGLLREQPDYGYQLKRRFEERIGAVWHLNIGQVYQELRAMDRLGLIAQVGADPGDDGQPARRRYQLTAKGGRFLERWLARSPTQPRPLRDETLIRLLVLHPSGSAIALDRVAAQERLYKRHLAKLLNEKRRLPDPKDGDLQVAHFGIEAALRHTEAHLQWLEYCRQQLESASRVPREGR